MKTMRARHSGNDKQFWTLVLIRSDRVIDKPIRGGYTDSTSILEKYIDHFAVEC